MHKKEIVAHLTAELGFEAVDLGPVAAAVGATEALADVMRLLMIDDGRHGRAHLALRSLTKQSTIRSASVSLPPMPRMAHERLDASDSEAGSGAGGTLRPSPLAPT